MKLIIATEEQKRQRDRLTHEAWGQRLDVDAFGRREIRLRSHPWALESMTTWLLVDDEGGVLASCETFRMESFRKAGGQGHTYGVASVYTEPSLRGRGYAGRMLALLEESLRQKDPLAHGALLFSEVGATLYEKAGYVARPSVDRLIPSREDPSLASTVEWIGEDRLGEALENLPRPDDRFLVWPTAGQLDWHLERERIYADLMGRHRPLAVGVSVEGGSLLWAADFKNERLAILVAHARDGLVASTLVKAAAHQAHLAGLAEVRLWEEPAFPLPEDLGERIPRDDDALPMFAPFGPIEPEDWVTIPRALWV